MIYKDSVGNTYTKLPTKPPNKSAKGAKPGPKHGRKSRYTGEKKKHGTMTGHNGPRARLSYYGIPKHRLDELQAMWKRQDARV